MRARPDTCTVERSVHVPRRASWLSERVRSDVARIVVTVVVELNAVTVIPGGRIERRHATNEKIGDGLKDSTKEAEQPIRHRMIPPEPIVRSQLLLRRLLYRRVRRVLLDDHSMFAPRRDWGKPQQ